MTFYAKPPKWLMNFCKPIKLLHSNDYTLYLHDTILSRTAGLASCHHAQIVLRWLAGGTRNVLLLLATQYRNGTKEEFERGQISATEACLPEWGRGPSRNLGLGLLRKQEKQMASQWKSFRHTSAHITFVLCGSMTQFSALWKWNISPLDLHTPFPR